MSTFLTFILYTIVIFIVPYFMGSIKHHKKHTNQIIIVASLICGLLAAFRGTSGTDSSMYIYVFNNGVNSISRWTDFEIGYIIIVNILKLLHLSYHVLFFLMAFIPSICCFKAIVIESDNLDVRIATLIYISDLYFFGFNGMRQFFAIGLCLYGFALFFDNKKKWTLLIIALASCFHKSALMCLAFLGTHIIYKSKHKKTIFAVITGLTLLLVSNRDLLGKIIIFITGKEYYGGYVIRDAETDTNLVRYYIKNLPLILIPVLQFKWIREKKKYFVFFVFMAVGIILSSLGAVTATQVSRLGMYFSYLKIFVCAFCATKPLNFKIAQVKRIRLQRYLIYIYFVFMFYYNYFIKGFSLLVPYGQKLFL